MNLDKIQYSDFFSKESYCKLQEYFGGYDDRREYLEIKEPLEDFKITLKVRDEFNINEEYIDKDFLKDFLIPGISKMRDRYFVDFKMMMERKAILTQEQLSGFLKLYRTKIKNYRESIHANDSVNERIIATLQISLTELEELLIEHIEDPYPEIKRKIQFNWSRTDVEYFFHLLRDKKIISGITDADLGRIIDGAFQCKDDKGTVKNIKGSRRHFTDFKNDDGRDKIQPNERLKKVFLEIFN